MFLVESVSNKHTYIKTDKQLKSSVFVNLIKIDRQASIPTLYIYGVQMNQQ